MSSEHSGAVPADEDRRLAEAGVVRLRADNPGPLTLSGTNTWLFGEGPCWVIDPGPALDDHRRAVEDAVSRRGGAAGIALTHDHADHSQSAAELSGRLGCPVFAARGAVDHVIAGGDRVGPLEVLPTPGHAPDHVAYLAGGVCFSGDAVLGEGSVFVAPDPGALSAYLQALEALGRRELQVICPGHGPPVWDPHARIEGYVAHRLERERALVAALDGGARTVAELLDAAWSDVPELLRPAAALTLAAHLDRLGEQGRLPPGVQRPAT